MPTPPEGFSFSTGGVPSSSPPPPPTFTSKQEDTPPLSEIDELVLRLSVPSTHHLSPGSPEDRQALMQRYEEIVTPESRARSTAVAKQIGATGLEVGLGFLAPGALGVKALGKGAALAPKIANTAKTAFTSALGAAGGREVAEQAGLSDSTSLTEKGDRIAQDIAIGGGVGAASNVVGSAVKSGANSLSRTLNFPERIARLFGATNSELNDFGRRSIDQSVEFLLDNSARFNDEVVSSLSIKKSAQNIASISKDVGEEIGGFFAKHKNLKVPLDEFHNHPKVLKIIATATDPTRSASVREGAEQALKELPKVLLGKEGGKVLPLNQFWRGAQRDLQESQANAFFNKEISANSTFAQNLQELRNAASETIDNIVTSSGAEGADQFLKNKALWSNLRPVEKALSKAAAKDKGKSFVDKNFNLGALGKSGTAAGAGAALGGAIGGLPGAALGATAAGIAQPIASSNAARGGAFNLANSINNIQSPGIGANAVIAGHSLIEGATTEIEPELDPELERKSKEFDLDLFNLTSVIIESGDIFIDDPEDQQIVLSDYRLRALDKDIPMSHVAKQASIFNDPREESLLLPLPSKKDVKKKEPQVRLKAGSIKGPAEYSY